MRITSKGQVTVAPGDKRARRSLSRDRGGVRDRGGGCGDVLGGDERWEAWSAGAIAQHATVGRLRSVWSSNPRYRWASSAWELRVRAGSAQARASGDSMVSRLSRGEGVRLLPPSRRNASFASARLLHRRPCGRQRNEPADPRSESLPDLLPEAQTDRSGWKRHPLKAATRPAPPAPRCRWSRPRPRR